MAGRRNTVNIAVKAETRERLKEFGWYSDTMDDILVRIMDHAEKNGFTKAGTPPPRTF